jgi:hypothetical protein
MLHKTSVALLLTLQFSVFSFAQKTADFLILDAPSKYTILNQYQQPLSESQAADFVPNTPVRIVNNNELLGDQFTHALTGLVDDKTCYIQKDEKGNLLGGSANVIRQCEIIGDTVLVVKDKAVPFYAGKNRSLPAGYLGAQESVIRIFRLGGLYFVKHNNQKTQYGWADFSANVAWKHSAVAAVAAVDPGFAVMLTDKIVDRFKKANESYRVYFDHFNKVTGSEKVIPAWQCEITGSIVHCTLNNPYKNGTQLDESTQYLVRDLENILIGKQYDVVADKGEITVKPKSGSR